MSLFDRAKEFVATTKGKLALVAGTVSLTMVQYASAATLNESISPILTSVTELFVPLLSMVIAAVPLIIAIAIIGFILGILGAILSKLRV